MIDAPRIEKPEPETGIFGVGWASATVQTQSVCDVHDAFLHEPPIHTNPLVQSVFSVQVLLQPTGGIGVGVGVDVISRVAVGEGVAVGLGVGVAVGEGVAVGLGVGVAVGEGVAVGVGVGVTVPVGVGVGVPEVSVILNVKVHAEAAALGCCWGTVGATCLVCESLPLVNSTSTASPMVRRTTINKYQCFFK